MTIPNKFVKDITVALVIFALQTNLPTTTKTTKTKQMNPVTLVVSVTKVPVP